MPIRNKLIYEMEREILGFDHGPVGAALLTSWKLPPTLTGVVENHHTPLEDTEYPLATAILNLADIFAKSMELGSSGDRMVPVLLPEVWKKTGMDVNSPAFIMESD